MKKKSFLLFLSICFYTVSFAQQLPKGFVYLSDIEPSITTELRYISNNNFIGKPIDGYHKTRVIVTLATANALQKVQQKLLKENLSLKIFDAYRPQRSVNHFVKWAKIFGDTLMKQQFYPKVPKSALFKLGYIASKSGHTRGSTVDLTIINLKNNKELDMGSPYDFFGVQSHTFYENITLQQKENRMLLRKLMIENGFKPYNKEWWHFTLINEPYPNTYFNFPVE